MLHRILAAALVLALVPSALAQVRPDTYDPDAVPQGTRVQALTHVRLVAEPGSPPVEGATVVLRDGLIEAAGRNVRIPAGADVLDGGDSLTVYAGFVTGFSHAGLPEREEEVEQPERPGEPTFRQAGIEPQRDVLDRFDPTHDVVGALRKAGFTAAHVAPRGQMLPGRTAVVLLGGGRGTRLVVRRDVAQLLQFEDAPGRAYPNTEMAVMAQMRQLVGEARRRAADEDTYASGPQGRERPLYDEAHAALFPVVEGALPLAYLAEDGPLAVHRALRLHEQLGLASTPMLLNVKAPHLALEPLRARTGSPLFLALDLPDAPADTAVTDTLASLSDSLKVMTPEAAGSFFVSDLRTRSFRDVREAERSVGARQVLERQTYYEAPGQLRRAGILFGFATEGADDPHATLARLVREGLSEADALAALTTDAAGFLGLSNQLGTIEPGKLANLVVVHGDSYFDEDAEVVYVFVEGQRFDVED